MKTTGNEIKYHAQISVACILNMMLSGAVLQTFLAESKVGEQKIAFFMALMQVIQMVAMLLVSPKTDRIKGIIRVTAISHFASIPLVLFMLAKCYIHTMNTDASYIILMLTGAISQLGFGLYNILSYKLPYHIIDMNRYGTISAIAGVVSGSFMFLLSVLLSRLQERFSYFAVMTGMFLAAIIAILVFAVVTLSMKKVEGVQKETILQKRMTLFHYRPFTKLIVPNLARGFCSGILTISVTIGYYFDILDSRSAGILVILTTAMTILSCMAYPLLVKWSGEGKTLLLSAVIMLISMPLMFLGRSTLAFLLFYAVAYFFMNIINYAVPVAVVKIIDYEVAGRYNGFRMLLHTGGMAMAGFVCVAMLEYLGGVLTMTIAATLQVYASYAYHKILKNHV